ncbi:ComF family protein [Blastococcus sp. LR1]|uniref:ComF family protein n=1 Tax=Blastococcus sp. LR1 TaxID=2877000 RepID=UPI001CCBCC71|nr:phosphoribosyltransferase family protein [Blastococcus sp. LR1]MCA0146266.1 ComF family protein [Blastococcus sp. LR1]
MGLLPALADLVLPRTCAGCGVPGRSLCGSCAALLTVPHLAQPRRFPAGFPPTVAAGAYAGAVRPVVNAFKEHGRAELARPLGAALALAVAAVRTGLVAPAGPVLLVPVPGSRAALASRGRDHVRELTVRAVAELREAGVPAAEHRLLRRRGRVHDSAGLTAVQRRANLAGTFVLDPRRRRAPAGAILVLVDDVVTTGATLCAAAEVLAEAATADRTVVLAAVVAATPRPSGPSRTEPTGPAGYRLRTVPVGHHDRLSGPGTRD